MVVLAKTRKAVADSVCKTIVESIPDAEMNGNRPA